MNCDKQSSLPKFLASRNKQLSLAKPLIMGILNVTPDSFSDGGKFKNIDQAVDYALQMVEQGADIIDIGGESTGPGSKNVSVEEELARVLPVLQELRKKSDVWISVDTYKSEVARRVLQEGADMINDVTALRGDPEMASVLRSTAAESSVKNSRALDIPVILMYSKDQTPRTTREETQYEDIIATVKEFFEKRIAFAVKNGIAVERILLDPGMGAFVSADPKYSLQILSRLEQFLELGRPLVVGPSRKSFIGQVLNAQLHERLEGSLAACAVAVMHGTSILRVHDVQETRRLVDMVHAIKTA